MVTVLIIRFSFLIILPMILDTCFQWTVQIFQHIEVNNVKIKELVDKLFIAHHIQRSFISHHGGLGIELAQDLCNLESGWWLKPQKDREGNPQALGLINRLFGYLMGNFEAPVTHSLNDSRPSWVRKGLIICIPKECGTRIFISFQPLKQYSIYHCICVKGVQNLDMLHRTGMIQFWKDVRSSFVCGNEISKKVAYQCSRYCYFCSISTQQRSLCTNTNLKKSKKNVSHTCSIPDYLKHTLTTGSG